MRLKTRVHKFYKKYQLTKFVLSGDVFDRGTTPYQNAAKLITLRNELVHTTGELTHKTEKGQLLEVESRIVKILSGTGTIARPDEVCDGWERERGTLSKDGNWLQTISTKALALWSCKVAAGMVTAILYALPPCEFTSFSSGHYRLSFRIALDES